MVYVNEMQRICFLNMTFLITDDLFINHRYTRGQFLGETVGNFSHHFQKKKNRNFFLKNSPTMDKNIILEISVLILHTFNVSNMYSLKVHSLIKKKEQSMADIHHFLWLQFTFNPRSLEASLHICKPLKYTSAIKYNLFFLQVFKVC